MDIDKAKAAALGVALDDINQTLQMYLGSLYVNSFNGFGRHWQVTHAGGGPISRSGVRYSIVASAQQNGPNGVPRHAWSTVREITGPIFVLRYNLSTAAPITGSLVPGVSSGEVIGAVDKLADESLPRSMKIEWTELMYLQIIEGNTT